jgi:gliding motility-associated protein GldL
MKTKIINTIYSWGAVAVICGAWSKIEHFRFADTMLTIGLLTECGIFFLYGFQELVGKSEPTTVQPGTEYPNVGRLEELIEQQNAILRDVYKTSK